jgi:hypothetical protein
MGFALKDRVWSVTVGTLVNGSRSGLKVDGHRIAFRVEKSLKPEPNKCECVIYNLNAKHRAQIAELRPKEGDARGIPVMIEAGYKAGGVGLIWLGDLRTTDSTHPGPDWVTKIETGDGESAKKSSVSVAYGPGTTPDIALRAVVRALGIDEGNVAAAAIKLRQAGAALFPQRAVFSGNAARQIDLICQSAGLEWSVQDGAVQILERGALLGTKAIKLSTRTGLVESPSVDHKGVLSFKMFIQPGVKCGSLIVLDSKAARGNYRITKAVWEGDTHAQPWYISGEATRY